MRLAEKDLAHWREEAAARHDQLRSVHNQLARDYQRVRQEEEIRRIAPERAAQERARLEREITWHRTAITELQQMAAAKTSEAVGGHLDLPIEAYRGEPGAPLSARRKGWRWTWEAVVLALALALVGFAVILALPLFTDSDWSLWGRSPAVLECEFNLDPAQGKSLQVDCRNVGDRPIELYLPWPDALPPEIESGDRSVGGFELQLREQGQDAFRTYPVPSEWWLYNGRPLNSGEPVVVEPLLTVRLLLDVTMVKSIGQGIDAMRLTAKRGDGEVFDTHEIDFAVDAAASSGVAPAAPQSRRLRAPVVAPPPGSDVYIIARLWSWWPILELEAGKTYNFGFAIHDDNAFGRFHHVSLGYKLGIDAKADVTAGVLPHGDKRRLELAIILAGDPEVLLLDDPVAGLDAEMVLALKACVEERRAHHPLTVVAALRAFSPFIEGADRLVVLRDGRVEADGARDTVARTVPEMLRKYVE